MAAGPRYIAPTLGMVLPKMLVIGSIRLQEMSRSFKLVASCLCSNLDILMVAVRAPAHAQRRDLLFLSTVVSK
jgi:hypothetical protein